MIIWTLKAQNSLPIPYKIYGYLRVYDKGKIPKIIVYCMMLINYIESVIEIWIDYKVIQ